MSKCTITLQYETKHRIDMRWLGRAMQSQLSSKETLKHTLQIGKKTVTVGEIFSIEGKLSSSDIQLSKTTTSCDYVGYQLPASKILTVDGHVGHYAGAELAGGQLNIEADTLDYTGCGMKAGVLIINGNSGDYLGGAYAGQKKGMAGGTILVKGNSGDFTGDLMRKGLIMVTGNIGHYCASRMIAGTITNLGTVGENIGQNMRRGTLLLPELPKNMPAYYENCGRHNLGYLTLLLHELRKYDSEFRSLHPMRRRVQRYLGDTSVNGLGELLIWIG